MHLYVIHACALTFCLFGVFTALRDGVRLPEWLFPLRGRWLRYALGGAAVFLWTLLLLVPPYLALGKR